MRYRSLEVYTVYTIQGRFDRYYFFFFLFFALQVLSISSCWLRIVFKRDAVQGNKLEGYVPSDCCGKGCLNRRFMGKEK